ncbi:Sec2p-domain-containing protein, partial [Xylona heveae TC161]
TAGSSGDGSQASPPDLSNELATLNNKLIDAINHQAKLDDTLAATRADLDAARKKIHSLEAQGQNYSDMIAKGVLVKKADTEGERLRLLAKLEEEIRMKDAAEKGRKGIEQELESLTAALFEEANKMVAAARKDREAAERKNEQLRSQIKDMEVLLASHQEQLAELKTVMQQMSSDRDETETTANASTAPSTPALGNQDGFGKNFESLGLAPNHSAMEDVPAQPLSFPHLLHPVLRTDLQAYDDFHALLQISKTAPPSRASSGSYGSLNVMGLRNLAAQASSTSSAGNNPNSPSATPSSDGPLQLVSLKETPFYKRALVEDVEPTLRLETAPGLSWLARRTVVNSMTDGSLVVEPIPSAAKRYPFTCALCGESRKGDEYARTHRFRVSENESAQRYPLCTFCLARVRVTCDFVGFLRMVRDGHWRAVGEEGEKAAWEECVRLRERMFWTRIGGGVVPAFVQV